VNDYVITIVHGPTDLTTILPPEMRNKSTNVVAGLLGGPVSEEILLAREASPISYVSKDLIPTMLFHGEKDKLVSVAQSITLNAALKAAGAQSTLIIYTDKGHAFALSDATLLDVEKFFEQAFKDQL
jgi:dipeptidyl aminopeptidase/acylaminoacyl peptidase